MPKYNKLSPSDFRKKLKNGEYESLTGAKRAIGKMQEWTEKERDSARAFAAKHWGEEPTPAKKKVAKKPAKKADKKTTKATTARSALTKKKAGKSARGEVQVTSTPKKAASKGKYGPGKGGMPKPNKPAAKKASTKKAASKAPSTSSSTTDRIENAQHTIGVLSEAAELLEKCKTDGGVNVSKGLEKIAETATKLVEDLDRNIVQRLTQQDVAQAAKFAQAAPAPGVPGNGASAPITTAVQPPVQPPVAAPVIPPTSG